MQRVEDLRTFLLHNEDEILEADTIIIRSEAALSDAKDKVETLRKDRMEINCRIAELNRLLEDIQGWPQ
jgi:hypothetical protein